MRKTVFILAIIVLLSAGAFAADQSAPVNAPALLSPAPCVLMALRGLHPRLVPAIATALELTSEQQTKVTALLTKDEEDSQPAVRAQMNAAEEFVNLLGKADASEPALTRAAKDAEAAEETLLIQKVKTLTSLRALLTVTQNQALSKWLERTSAPWQPRPAMHAPTPLPAAGK